MNFKKLGNYTVSEIAYGMWRVNDAKLSPQDAVDLLVNLREQKINLIDTAAIYGHGYHSAEKVLGEAFQLMPKLRKDFVIVTKCGIEIRLETNHYNNTYDYIVDQVMQSLASLKIETIDILLLHRPDIFADYEQVCKALTYLVENNFIKQVGVSNYTPMNLLSLNNFLRKRNLELCTNQIEINPFTTEHYDNDNVNFLKGEEISPMIWSPLGGGKLFEHNEVSDYIAQLAKIYECTPTHICLSYLRHQGLNPIIVLGSNKFERYQEAIAGLNVEISREHMYAILKKFRKEDVR